VGGDLVYGVWKTRGGPFGPFINRNHFAGWMLMALPLALGYFVALVVRGMRGAKPGWHGRLLWFSTREASRATLTGFSILPLGLALVLTLSRSGISCFAAALVLTGAIVVTRRGGGARRVALTGYLAFVGTTALVWAGLDAVAARFAEMPGSDFGGRWQAWQDTWQIIVRHPIFGTGMGTYGDVMFVFQTSNPIERFVQAHNDYLNILADGGLLVALPVAALIFVITREIRRRFREDTPDATTWWIRAGAVTGLVAIALQEVVEFSLQMPANAALFAVLVAIAVGRLPHRRAFGPRAAGH
jgi:O-antigen ligase